MILKQKRLITVLEYIGSLSDGRAENGWDDRLTSVLARLDTGPWPELSGMEVTAYYLNGKDCPPGRRLRALITGSRMISDFSGLHGGPPPLCTFELAWLRETGELLERLQWLDALQANSLHVWEKGDYKLTGAFLRQYCTHRVREMHGGIIELKPFDLCLSPVGFTPQRRIEEVFSLYESHQRSERQ